MPAATKSKKKEVKPTLPVRPVIAYEITMKCGHVDLYGNVTLPQALEMSNTPCANCEDEVKRYIEDEIEAGEGDAQDGYGAS